MFEESATSPDLEEEEQDVAIERSRAASREYVNGLEDSVFENFAEPDKKGAMTAGARYKWVLL